MLGTQTVATTQQKVFASAYTQTDSTESTDSSEDQSSEGQPPSEGKPPSEYVRSSSDETDCSDMEDDEPSLLHAQAQEENESVHKSKKYIIFFSALLRLLSWCCCPDCGHKELKISTSEIGTMVIISLICTACNKTTPWHSQPYLGNIPAGNILLSAATLFAGATVSKVFRVLSNMGVAVISPRTFFRHQTSVLHKTIRKVWKDQQTALLAALQGKEGKLVCGGDGRADSPGHSAKYGSYTIIELEEKLVLDIQLVQVCLNS